MSNRAKIKTKKRLPRLDFRLLFESGPALYLVLDPQFNIVAVSDAYLKATLTRRKEILGRNIFAIFPDSSKESTGPINLRASLERVIQLRKQDAMAVQKYDVQRPESEGGQFEEKYWSPMNTPIFSAQGELIYIIHQAVDVTEFIRSRYLGASMEQIGKAMDSEVSVIEAEIYRRAQDIQEVNKELRESRAELDRFFGVSLDMLCISGFDGYFKRVNPAFEKVLGFSPEEICAKTYLAFIHPDDIEITQRQVTKQLSEGDTILNFENRYRCKDGSYKWLSWKSVPIDNLMYAVARDVTRDKAREEEIEGLNRNLEKSIEHLTMVNKELESFSYSVSHDLRAPLRTIIGFSKILLEDHGHRLPMDAQDTLLRIISATQKMGQLIDGLLALSQLSRTDLIHNTVNLSTIAQEIIAEIVATDPNRKVEWKIAKNMLVQGDSRLLRAMMTNLLGNAWKFTSKLAQARIEFGWEKKQGEKRFYVRDNGAGFDMRHITKLFGTFQRLHSVKEFQGTGIGLATVQKIIHRHGGRIWAHGEVDQGATFYFTI